MTEVDKPHYCLRIFLQNNLSVECNSQDKEILREFFKQYEAEADDFVLFKEIHNDDLAKEIGLD